ncbi:hypothetical protein A3A36_02580 [Candidatus Kaiserbacteria bacterium RIFCSPLOWO2_01_FULL_52_12b]|uniref:Uncharacterized protein n=1 Tax=Candidatus Kaiserbacteria bacterium RIFCSPLOWO2_01_FULL_52_12b TaxID=1798509 RepID=A0A1F6EWV1_9BACT|nr:MAG: hypothetical protein A3A36_02580 [Candidatus Kaiserbacteria bacterium RIFCSPLOWO2_01_FULL_52_12b]
MERSPRRKDGKNIEGALAAKLKEVLETVEPQDVTDLSKERELEIAAWKRAKMIADQKQFDKDPVGTTYHVKDRRIRNLERKLSEKKD